MTVRTYVYTYVLNELLDILSSSGEWSLLLAVPAQRIYNTEMALQK